MARGCRMYSASNGSWMWVHPGSSHASSLPSSYIDIHAYVLSSTCREYSHSSVRLMRTNTRCRIPTFLSWAIGLGRKEKQAKPRLRWRGILPRHTTAQPNAPAYVGQGPEHRSSLTCLNNIRCFPHRAQNHCRKVPPRVVEAPSQLQVTILELLPLFPQHNRAYLFIHPHYYHKLEICQTQQRMR